MSSVSVLIPIYYKESVQTIQKCIASIANQDLQPDEIVCVLDDPSTPEIEVTLDEEKEKRGLNIVKCYCQRGRGLGAVLNVGVNHCSCDYIARMDADDIARKDRLSKELNYLIAHPDVDVVGSNIAEFDSSVDQIIAYRNVPTDDKNCKKMLKRRDPINHMTAMFRRESVLKAGNYSTEMMSCEDTYLWIAFYESGLIFANIPESLVLVHAGADMYKRRGGKKAYRFVAKAIEYKKKVGLISKFDELLQKCVNYGILVIMPNSLRAFVYEKFLRKNAKGRPSVFFASP